MHDIDLWHLLTADFDAKASSTHRLLCTDELSQLAERPLCQRVPFLDPIQKLINHPLPAIRREVVRVFYGANGWRARQFIVNAFDDDDAAVRMAAVEALRHATPRHSLLCHALFHARHDVREAAMTIATEPAEHLPAHNNAGLAVYLLADPLLKEKTLQRLQGISYAELSPSLIEDLHVTGYIDDAVARQLLLSIDKHSLLNFMNQLLSSGRDNPFHFLAWMLRCFWPSGDGKDVTPSSTSPDEQSSTNFPDGFPGFLRQVRSSTFGFILDENLFRLCNEVANERGVWSVHLLATCMLCDLKFLFSEERKSIPPQILRQSIGTLYQYGHSVPNHDADELGKILKSDVCRRESNQLDLWVIGGLLHRRSNDGFQLLLKQFNPKQIAAAFWEAPLESTKLLTYSGDQASCNTLIDEILNGRDTPFARALMVCTVSAGNHQLIETWTAKSAVAVISQLRNLSTIDACRVSDNKSRSIAHGLCSLWVSPDRVEVDCIAQYLNEWLDGERVTDETKTLSNREPTALAAGPTSQSGNPEPTALAAGPTSTSGHHEPTALAAGPTSTSGHHEPTALAAGLIGSSHIGSNDHPTEVTIEILKKFKIGIDLLTTIAAKLQADRFCEMAIRRLTNRSLRSFIELIPYCPGLSYGVEVKMAECLLGHEDSTLDDWAKDRIVVRSPAVERDRTKTLGDDGTAGKAPVGHPLSDHQVREIETCAPSLLEDALQPTFLSPRTRVVEALSARAACVTEAERVAACVGLLASGDTVDEVLAVFDRFCGKDDSIESPITVKLLSIADHTELQSLGCAWLYRFERFAFRFGDKELTDSCAVARWLQLAIESESPKLGSTLFDAVARVLAIWNARQRSRAETIYDPELVTLLTDCLLTPCGETAAWILVRAFHAKFPAIDQQTYHNVERLLPALTDEVRAVLTQWIDIDANAGSIRVIPRPAQKETAAELVERISQSSDLEELSQWLASSHSGIVEEAAIRLISLEAKGLGPLLGALSQVPPLPCANTIAESIGLWPHASFPHLMTLIDDESPLPEWLRFVVSLNLLEAIGSTAPTEEPTIDRQDLIGLIQAMLLQPCDRSWVQSTDADRLLRQYREDELPEQRFALCVSPHPFIYKNILRALCTELASKNTDASAAANIQVGLQEFLRCDSERDGKTRLMVAITLSKVGNGIGYPLMVAEAVRSRFDAASRVCLPAIVGPFAVTILKSMLMAGAPTIDEDDLRTIVNSPGHQDEYEISQVLLQDAVSDSVRQSVAVSMRTSVSREIKLHRVANTFREGMKLGRELTGRLFTIEMIGGSNLGYTRLTENRIYVNPTPLLSGVPHGKDIVEGLILHELGHHMYHRHPEAMDIWQQAASKGLDKLLNLVFDEHLERNLRAIDEDFGNKLKQLGAYAFNRTAKDFHYLNVLEATRSHTWAVFAEHPPSVSRHPDCLRVRGGGVLQGLERRGGSFARFFRALRLGLGDRTGDPKVAAALQLFGKSFRHHDVGKLYEICLQLLEIFGDDIGLLEWLNQELLCSDPDSDISVLGEGIGNSDIQREIERITSPPTKTDGKGRSRLCVNVSDNASFEPILNIRRLEYDPVAFANYAKEVARSSRQFRQFLLNLGVLHLPQYRRTSGRRIDRSRINDLVIRNDPRVLISRETRECNDLFIAVVVDCSGSMQFDDNIMKARLFAAMLAVACRGVKGVELRLFGFTSEEIFDAGDASRPAVSQLEASGGNNDSAALWHAAQVASQSDRKSKVLIMISDGLPTECSTTSLKGLVARLSRRGICCAQVAVRPLAEVCFQHYVELGEGDHDVLVRRFGGIVAKLVKTTRSHSK